MVCKPGDIKQIECSGEDICRGLQQTAANAAQLVDHENRLTVNETGIAENKQAILDLGILNIEPRVSQNESDIATLNIRVTGNDSDISTLETRVQTNSDNISINESDIATNSSNISSLTTRVGVNESNITNIQNELSVLPTNYAALSGNANQQFNVADPTSPTHAVSLQYADNAYPNANNFYTKIEADALFLGIQDKAYDSDMLGGIKYDKYVMTTMIATKDDPGIVRQATDSEAIAGLVDDVFMSPKQVADAIAAAP